MASPPPARDPVGRTLDGADRARHAFAHLALEIERPDDARAEHGLAHRLHDLRRAVEGALGEFAHAPENSADEERRDGKRRSSAPERHHRVARDHHEHEPGHGDEVAREALHHELQRVAHAVGGEGEPRDELAGMAILEIGDVLLEQAVEHAPLGGGDDPVADPRQNDQRAVSRRAAHHEQSERLEREETHLRRAFPR